MVFLNRFLNERLELIRSYGREIMGPEGEYLGQRALSQDVPSHVELRGRVHPRANERRPDHDPVGSKYVTQ